MSNRKWISRRSYVDMSEFVDFSAKARAKTLKQGFTLHIKSDLTETDSAAFDIRSYEQGREFEGVVQPDSSRPWAEPTRFGPVVVQALGGFMPTSSNTVRLVQGEDTSDNTGPSDEGSTYGSLEEKLYPQAFGLVSFTGQLNVSEDLISDSGGDAGKAVSYLRRRFNRVLNRKIELAILQSNFRSMSTTFPGFKDLDNRSFVLQSGAGPDGSLDDAIVKAFVKVYEKSGLMANVIIISTSTWLSYLSMKATTKERLAGPVSLLNARQTLGCQVVVSPNCSQDRIWVLNSDPTTVYQHQEGLRVDFGTQNQQWGEGMQTARGKIRVTMLNEMDGRHVAEVILGS